MREIELLAALILATAYIIGCNVDAVRFKHRRRWISAAAGVSLAYIFVHVIPELSDSQAAYLESVGGRGLIFVETRVYLAALAGFVLFYGLDSMVFSMRTPEHLDDRSHHNEITIYWIHIIGFAVYSVMVGYLLVDWARGFQALILYTVALAFHLLVVDHSLRSEYTSKYDRSGRWILAGAVLAGWVIGAFAPLSAAHLAVLVGFISGGVVFNSLKDELPKSGEGSFVPFALAAIVYSLLLVISEE